MPVNRPGKGKACIDRAIAAGELDPARGAQAKRLLDEIEGDYLDALGPQGAGIRARIEAADAIAREAALRRRRTLMQVKTQMTTAKALERAIATRGEATIAKVMRAVIDDTGDPVHGIVPAVAQQRRIRASAHRMMADLLKAFHPLPGGFARNRAQLANVVREAHGVQTGDIAAAQMAKAWLDTVEYLRKSFNAAGGAIPKLARWAMPQIHSVDKIRAATYAQWRDFIMPLLDRAAIVDFRTGKPANDAALELMLRDVHETLRTDGWDTVEPSGAARGNPIGNRRRDHRVLHFKNGDAWLDYQARFGEGDAFAAMMGHIDGMAREIAAMRSLGPNPMATVRFLQDTVKKQANTLQGSANVMKREKNRADAEARFLETLYGHFIGANSRPENKTVGRWFSSLRQFLTSAQLGSAALSAVSDVSFGRVTAKFNGLPHGKIIARQMKLMNPLDGGDRKLALRLGLIAEEWSQIAATQMRYTGEVVSGEISRRLADGILRVSGLSAWTQAGRWAFQMEFLGHLADQAGKSLDQLDKPLREGLQRYGIGKTEWEQIRATKLYAPEKGGFIRPDDIADDGLATKLYHLIQSETEFAVPSTSLVGRARIMDTAPPGTIAGEMLRSTLMYKNFAVTLYFTHLMRGAKQLGAWNKARYYTQLMIATTLMGALSMQLKEVARGKDPQPMQNPRFWMAAMAQGGGLGLFGDFFLSDVNRFGYSAATSVAGPVVSFGSDLLKLTGGNLQELAQGKTTNFGREAIQFAGRYTPGSSLWYTRLALERGLLDQLQWMVDPNAAKSFTARRTSAAQDRGNDFWWAPGMKAPDRAPDFGNALRSQDEGETAAKQNRQEFKARGGFAVPGG